ncbi:MAG: hypothetical protein WBP41_12395, partial [Saprospiraceae bacterium]
DFNGFTQYISKNEFKFETKTDDLIKNLKDVSKEEAYSSDVSGQVDKLKSIVEQEKTAQVKSHDKAILQAIEREILGRYYFETGLVRHQLKNDPELAEAIAVLKAPDRYNSILKGS